MEDGGIYGDSLSAFPELLGEYRVFTMDALPGGGFGPRRYMHPHIEGIFRRVPGGKIGIMGENRERNDVATFWAYEDESKRITQGSYIEDNGDLFILTKDNNYVREGGFVRFDAALVPGPTDMQYGDRVVVQKALNGFQ